MIDVNFLIRLKILRESGMLFFLVFLGRYSVIVPALVLFVHFISEYLFFVLKKDLCMRRVA